MNSMTRRQGRYLRLLMWERSVPDLPDDKDFVDAQFLLTGGVLEAGRASELIEALKRLPVQRKAHHRVLSRRV